MASKNRTLTRPGVPRVLATLFTIASAAWTLYSVWDLLGVGPISVTAGTGAEGLWVGGMLAYRAKHTRLTLTAMLAGLGGTLAILAIHGASAYGWGGIVAVVPPLAAELFWHLDAQLAADPTELTTQQQAEVDDVIRQARHITARAAADQMREDAEHAARLARIRRDGDLRQAEDLVDFEVAVSRIDMQRQIARRAPLSLPAPVAEPATAPAAEQVVREGAHPGAPQVSGLKKGAAIVEVAEWCGEGAPSDLIVQILADQGVSVSDSYVRSELSKARRKAGAKHSFGFGAP
ncbi:hypothetical protein ACFZDG_18380 [Kitasatospora xanthocidica]|uniref:hypothetical protein n=1 Tax=Kitasatospora xanthocidica TaxID=83382 RepID=UPI0036E94EA9